MFNGTNLKYVFCPTHTLSVTPDMYFHSLHNSSVAFAPLDPVEQAFSEELIAYWASFVRSGNPNTYKLDRSPEWPLYNITHQQRMVLQQGTLTTSASTPETITEDEVERCAFVASKAQKQQN